MQPNEVSPSDRQTVRIAFNLSASHSSQLSRSFQTRLDSIRISDARGFVNMGVWLCVDSRGEGLDILKFASHGAVCRHTWAMHTQRMRKAVTLILLKFNYIDVINFREGSSIEAARYALD